MDQPRFPDGAQSGNGIRQRRAAYSRAVLFDLLVVEHGWCGHICPVGALYGVLGSKGVITVAATDRQKCNRCMDCFHVCPEPHVLRAPVLDEQSPVQVTSRDCMTCGRCVDVCSEDVFTITTRWSSGAKS